jgi:single-strand DNA-binding protein
MNALVNSVRLLGNLGRDPFVKTFEDGGKIANCSLATPHIGRDKEGNRVEDTDWHNLVIRGKLAEIAEKYLSKGSQLAIEGTLRSRKYTDASGEEKSVTEVLVNDFQMLGGKPGKGKQA